MVNWLALLLQIGGFGAVLLLALFVMGKWLLKRITAALDSYTTAYLQQKAAIDARIGSLEHLIEEQANLTRTVESIKDEFAAQAKSRDNRWEFRKKVYLNLIKTTHDMLSSFHKLAHAAKLKTDPHEALRKLAMDEVESERLRLTASIREFTTYAALAPLATADDVLPLLTAASKQVFREVNFDSPDAATDIQGQMKPLFGLLNQLQLAGRKDLWGTP